MSGLGKERSRLGKFLDKNGVSQTELVNESGLDKATISKLCAKNDVRIRSITQNAVIQAIRSLTGKNVRNEDFWNF